MALINCPECETEVSSLAEKCPKCSYPIKGKKENTVVHKTENTEGFFLQFLNAGCLASVIIIAIFLIVALIAGS